MTRSLAAGAPASRAGRWLLAAVALAILAITLPPGRETTTVTELCVICGERGTADALLNAIAFVPLGVGLALALRPTALLYLIGPAFSFFIEAAQVFIPGRDGSLGDIVFNSLGAAAGILLTGRALAARPRPGTAARLSLALAAGAAAVAWLAGILLEPSLPSSAYYSQWTPDLPHLAFYDARVLGVTIGGLEAPEGPLRSPGAVRSRLLAGARLEVRALAGPGVPRLGSLFSIYDAEQREIVLLGPDGDDLVFRIRRRAADARLDRPDLRLDGALRGVRPGEALRLAVWRREDGYCMEIEGIAARCGMGFTPGRAWALLLYPEGLPRPVRGTLDAAWLALLLLPAGFWARRRWESALAVALAAGGLLLATATTSLVGTAFTLVAAGAGFGIGAVLGRRIRRGPARRGP